MSTQPSCPLCRTNRHVSPYGSGKLFFCGKCKGQFDDDPNEGGDYSDFNQAIRLEREERRQSRQPNRSFRKR